jgi:hypothetical protein
VNSHCQSIVGEKADAMLQLWTCLQWDVSEPPLEKLLEVAKGTDYQGLLQKKFTMPLK